MEIIETLFGNVTNTTWQMIVMWVIGGALIFCAITYLLDYILLG